MKRNLRRRSLGIGSGVAVALLLAVMPAVAQDSPSKASLETKTAQLEELRVQLAAQIEALDVLLAETRQNVGNYETPSSKEGLAGGTLSVRNRARYRPVRSIYLAYFNNKPTPNAITSTV